MSIQVQPTVYQVRALDAFGNIRIVHAYVTADAAKVAIKTMKHQTGYRYVYVPVPNQPGVHWGIKNLTNNAS